ncbi:DUF1643 domain-containing protein [Microlunatus parietis]|uniref:Uncharacterized protein n=1 Tax=Microlunatus parietis TaxID=682979 RepID=A0A7Y9LCX0_9ACTN|nr:DUF1643 domain-containing protein [Microlunatus parietis]NYE72150.1 hypothetical protein [Microlunatus parietis]
MTEGTRTLRRVELAADLLGFARVEIANLFAESSQTTNEIALLGANESGWLSARQPLLDCITGAEGVLLAYGAAEPTGTARSHFRTQVEWLRDRIAASRLPEWQVGDGPRHPSRWQRWTHRAHPGVPFAEALRDSLLPTSTPRAESLLR